MKKTDCEEESENFLQWASSGKWFYPTHKTIPELKAGCYEVDFNNGSLLFKQLKLETDNLIKFENSISNLVVKEINRFWGLSKKFKAYGFIHKRGFLLHGAQGSGKTCILALISEELIKRYNGIILIADAPKILSMALEQFRDIELNRPIVVMLEDIDKILDFNEEDLLELLDGRIQVGKVVYVATTNYPSKINPRIINRPSRFDRVIKIEYPGAKERTLYLKTKIPKLSSADIKKFIKHTDGFSFAHLKELVVSVKCLDLSIEETIARLKNMKNSIKDSNSSSKIGI